MWGDYISNNRMAPFDVMETNTTKKEGGYQKTRDLGLINTQPNTSDITVYPISKVILSFTPENDFRALMKHQIKNVKAVFVDKIVITGIVGPAQLLMVRLDGSKPLKLRTTHNYNYMPQDGIVLWHDGSGTINEDQSGSIAGTYKLPIDVQSTRAKVVSNSGDDVVVDGIHIWLTFHTLNFHY
jgi:hypothetical protein